MKISAVYNSSDNTTPCGKTLVWPDSVLIRSGKPVFLPEYPTRIHLGFAAKISAVGKSIRFKFAHRYYNEWAPVVYILPEESSLLLSMGKDPLACDIVADYSIILGNSMPTSEGKTTGLEIDYSPLDEEISSMKETFEIKDLEESLNKAVADASARNTLKTGDLAAFILPRSLPAPRDTLLRVRVNNNLLIENKLK